MADILNRCSSLSSYLPPPPAPLSYPPSVFPASFSGVVCFGCFSPPLALHHPRVSLQEAGGAPAPNGAGADTGGEERRFVDAGFHALATSAVEAEEERAGAPPPLEERQQQQHASRNTNGAHGGKGGGSGKGRDSHDRSAMMYSVDGVAAAAAAEVVASSGKTSHPKVAGSLGEAAAGAGGDEKEEDEEDFGEVELVVTHDGGIIPVAAAAAAAAVDGDDVSADGTAPKPEKTPTVQGKGKGARKGGIRDGVEVGGSDDDAAVGSVRKIAAGKTSVGREKGGGGGDHDEEEEEGDGEGEEEERPLPPDIMLTLADDVLHRVMLFLNPEDIFECRVVSSRWEFPSHEAVFEGLCRRTYLAQVREIGRTTRVTRPEGIYAPACFRSFFLLVLLFFLFCGRRMSLRNTHRCSADACRARAPAADTSPLLGPATTV